MADYILFDFDGTVFDTAEGITKCVQYALERLGVKAELSELMCFCGPPLHEMFAQRYGFDEKKSLEAVRLYRERYNPVGWCESKPFEGMKELLVKLREDGKKLAVATSKPREFTERILEKHGMTELFDIVCGSEFDGTRGQKWEVVSYALERFGITPDEAIMVGDRKYDVFGAAKCGVKCVGVRFGYAEENELEEAGAVYVAADTEKLYEYLK